MSMMSFSLLFCLLAFLAIAAPQSPALPNVQRLKRLSKQLPNGNFEVPKARALSFAKKLKKLWAFNKPDKYQYQYSSSCFCPVETLGPWLITVDNGVSTVEFARDEVPRNFDLQFALDFTDDIAESVGTIDKIYDVAIFNLQDGVDFVRLQVDFKNFIITSFYTDFNYQYIDEEFSLAVTNFKVL